MNRHEKTAAKIRELVPRLRELSFGCKVSYDWGDENISHYIVSVYDGGNFVEVLSWAGGYSSSTPNLNINPRLKVIGHQIRLEDVLEALSFIVPNIKGESFYMVDPHGNFIEVFNSVLMKRDGVWEIGKPFSEQSQECQDFIADLLNIDKDE